MYSAPRTASDVVFPAPVAPAIKAWDPDSALPRRIAPSSPRSSLPSAIEVARSSRLAAGRSQRRRRGPSRTPRRARAASSRSAPIRRSSIRLCAPHQTAPTKAPRARPRSEPAAAPPNTPSQTTPAIGASAGSPRSAQVHASRSSRSAWAAAIPIATPASAPRENPASTHRASAIPVMLEWLWVDRSIAHPQDGRERRSVPPRDAQPCARSSANPSRYIPTAQGLHLDHRRRPPAARRVPAQIATASRGTTPNLTTNSSTSRDPER